MTKCSIALKILWIIVGIVNRKLEVPIWNFKLEGEKMAKKLIHICEVCGKTEILTPEEAFNEGWDYPPRMGGFGIVGPRTCGECPINLTVWWALVSEKKRVSELSQKQRETIKRIQGEPESIMPIVSSDL